MLPVAHSNVNTTSSDPDTHHPGHVELERCVVVGPRFVQVDEEEEVSPLVVLMLHVVLKALQIICVSYQPASYATHCCAYMRS